MGMHGVELILTLLLLFVAAFAAVSQRLRTPYPIVLVVAGLLLGITPGGSPIAFDPHLIYLLVLPPLLYSAAWLTPWRDFSDHLGTLWLLALGLVGLTIAGIAIAASFGAGRLLPGFDWRLCVILGGAAAATDAIAAKSIAKRCGLPKRIGELLEGSSLLNDAVGLLVLVFAVTMVMQGKDPTVSFSLLRLLYLAFAGIASGLIFAYIAEWFERRIDDGPTEIAVSIVAPYAAFLTAEAMHASGVLAVLAAGLYLSRKGTQYFSPGVRFQAEAAWNSLTFILNGLVFVLAGVQLPSVLAGVSEWSVQRIIVYGALFSVFLILLRILWMFPLLHGSHFIRTRVFHRDDEERPTGSQIFVAGWSGMRGAIALAAAMSIPRTVADGSPFPHRDLIVFLTFCAVLVTLVFQGLTLAPLIRILGLAGTPAATSEDQEARRLLLQSILARMDEAPQGSAGFADVGDDLAQR